MKNLLFLKDNIFWKFEHKSRHNFLVDWLYHTYHIWEVPSLHSLPQLSFADNTIKKVGPITKSTIVDNGDTPTRHSIAGQIWSLPSGREKATTPSQSRPANEQPPFHAIVLDDGHASNDAVIHERLFSELYEWSARKREPCFCYSRGMESRVRQKQTKKKCLIKSPWRWTRTIGFEPWLNQRSSVTMSKTILDTKTSRWSKTKGRRYLTNATRT